jgi:hypothetical protein
MRRPTSGSFAIVALAVLAACSDPDSTTDLNTEGPPMVQQVFVSERVLVGTSERIRTGLAFGDHPGVGEEDDREVLAAVARGNQSIRVVLDELVIGNALEELACADGSFSRVPRGSTPDDVADCAGSDLSKCREICVNADGPVGILDENLDGAADDTRMIEYMGGFGANIVCDGENIPLDAQLSFYSPSGNQQIPAGDIGINGLGPAIVLEPLNGLKTGATCTIAFRDEVVDKDGNTVCAPPGGDVSGTCTGGDTAEISFGVEPLKLAASDPSDGATIAAVAAPATMLLQFNAAIEADSLGALGFTAGGADAAFSAVVSTDDPTIVTLTVDGGFPAATAFVLSIASGTDGLTDVFGGALPGDIAIAFETM